MSDSIAARIQALDWSSLDNSLSQFGYAKTTSVLTPDECRALIELYPQDERFRSHIDMARYRFGEGDYKYFARPLPPLVQSLRERLYAPLAPIANRWMEQLGDRTRFPDTLDALLAQCAKHGQNRPTPLLLRYEAGDYNCLHQDLYGDVSFPLQVAAFLSQPGVDYTGGEFLLLEQRPRAQSAGEVVIPSHGELVIFTTRFRPARSVAKSARAQDRYYKVAMRHGVSRVRSGLRYTLGVIFHDAK